MKRPGALREHVPLAPLTTYRIGGPARYYIQPERKTELLQALPWAEKNGIPLFVLGAGSNVLVADRGYEGLILHLQGFGGGLHNPDKQGRWRVGAGASLLHWVRRSASRGFAGVEALMGIPGTVGGALRMNAGAFGIEIGQKLISADVIHLQKSDPSSEYAIEAVKPRDIGFAYRQAPGLRDTVILSADFQLTPDNPQRLLQHVREIIALRRERQPLDWPSCGSVFKRPAGDYAGRLIEASGLRGQRLGGAQISPRHANFISNLGGAMASDILGLIKLAKRKVFEDHGVQLEREVILVGFNEEELEGA